LKLFGKRFGKLKRLDLLEVIHVEIAKEHLETGELVAIHPMPIEFGGVAGPLNTAYIPSSAMEKFDKIMDRLRHLAEDGEINKLRIKQDYRGASIVPTRFYFIGSLEDQEGIYNLKLEVW